MFAGKIWHFVLQSQCHVATIFVVKLAMHGLHTYQGVNYTVAQVVYISTTFLAHHILHCGSKF